MMEVEMLESDRPLIGFRMDFGQAMRQVAEGKKVARDGWVETGYFVILKENKVQLKKPDGNYYDWIVSKDDLSGDDWIKVN